MLKTLIVILLISKSIFADVFKTGIGDKRPPAYEESADDLFETMLGKVYQVQNKYSLPKLTTITTNDHVNVTMDFHGEQNKLHNHEDYVKYLNYSKDDFEMDMVENSLYELIQYNISAIPDFDTDHLEITSRRFDDFCKKPKTEPPLDGRRRYNPEGILREGKRCLDLMEQFIYATRYRLPYAQILRTKYKDQTRYKIGYCLSLLRQLKIQQLLIASGYRRNVYKVTNLYFHIMMYDKMIRLDVDIKDVIKLTKKLEEQRALEEKVFDPYENHTEKEGIVSGFPGFGFPGAGGPGMTPKLDFMPGIPGLGAPGMPGAPSAPGAPGMAVVPSAPGAPGMAGVPSAPGAPGMAGVPSAPGAPGMAGVPSAPGAPVNPNMPSAPGPPASPDVASAPGAPGSPDGKVPPKADVPSSAGRSGFISQWSFKGGGANQRWRRFNSQAPNHKLNDNSHVLKVNPYANSKRSPDTPHWSPYGKNKAFL